MNNLRRIRLANGMSQSQLANAAGVNVRTYQRIEQGVRDINATAAITVYNLAVVLGCAVEDLLEIPEDKEG